MINKLPGKMRLCIALSIAWIVLIGIVVNEQHWQFDTETFVYWGILPVLGIWIYFWVREGFKKDKEEGKHSGEI